MKRILLCLVLLCYGLSVNAKTSCLPGTIQECKSNQEKKNGTTVITNECKCVKRKASTGFEEKQPKQREAIPALVEPSQSDVAITVGD